jgi:hypothetical protein
MCRRARRRFGIDLSPDACRIVELESPPISAAAVRRIGSSPSSVFE